MRHIYTPNHHTHIYIYQTNGEQLNICSDYIRVNTVVWRFYTALWSFRYNWSVRRMGDMLQIAQQRMCWVHYTALWSFRCKWSVRRKGNPLKSLKKEYVGYITQYRYLCVGVRFVSIVKRFITDDGQLTDRFWFGLTLSLKACRRKSYNNWLIVRSHSKTIWQS